ncbi:hypothetical protein JCM3770_006936 [Rhodotorula araucariae]
MFTRTAARAATLARPAARRLAPRAVPLPHSHLAARWAFAGLAAGAGAAVVYAAHDLKPEWIPAPQPLHADAPAPSGIHLDPTTKTPFPSRLASPDGTPLRLVGTGVRTVSFLNIKVYAVGFYVSEREFNLASQGKLAGWDGYTPERLIPPFNLPTDGPERPKGEQLIETLLEKADAAVVIIPLRNTSLPHLRDGFSRALVARMKVPQVAGAFTDAMNESTGVAMVQFKSFFPSRTLPKGLPLELYYSAKDRSILFQLRDEKTRAPEVLGTLREATLATQLMVSYFSNDAAPSPELVKSVAMGFDPVEHA